ncbi:MAG: hemerythrin domain-containing protein [Alphaproteobacteria bacterium]
MPEGILNDLHEDHEEVSGLIEQMIKTEDSKERGEIFKEMMSKLLAHSHAEEAVLYKKMEKSENEKSRTFAYEGENEHQIVEQQLQQMARARNKASEQWTAQASVLKDLIEHHVEEEESTGFRCARSDFDSETLEKMGDQFRKQKEKLLQET